MINVRTILLAMVAMFMSTSAMANVPFTLPAPWINAIIEVESGGDPRAVSSAGAKGLMQVTDIALEDVVQNAGRLDERCNSLTVTSDLFDPTVNVTAGICYIQLLQHTFKSVPLTLAAYNMGPTALKKAILTKGGIPQEVVDYVNKVGAAYNKYRKVIEPQPKGTGTSI